MPMSKTTRDHKRRSAQHWRQCGDLALALQLLLPLVQPLGQTLCRRFRIAGVDALLPAGALLLPQPGGAGVPVVDLASQPGADFPLNAGDLFKPPLLHLGQMGKGTRLAMA